MVATHCTQEPLLETVYSHCSDLEVLQVKPCMCQPPSLYQGYKCLKEIKRHLKILKELYFDVEIGLCRSLRHPSSSPPIAGEQTTAWIGGESAIGEWYNADFIIMTSLPDMPGLKILGTLFKLHLIDADANEPWAASLRREAFPNRLDNLSVRIVTEPLNTSSLC